MTYNYRQYVLTFCPYTDYTNYTTYTDYTIARGKKLKANDGVTDPKNVQTNPPHAASPTAYSCGIRGKGRHRAGIYIKQREPVISDKLACCT